MGFELQPKKLVKAIRKKLTEVGGDYQPCEYPKISSERKALETLINAVQYGAIVRAQTITDKLKKFYEKHKQLDIFYFVDQMPDELQKEFGVGTKNKAAAIITIAGYTTNNHNGNIFGFVEDLLEGKCKVEDFYGFGVKAKDLFLRDMGHLDFMPIDRYGKRFAERFGIARFYGIPNNYFIANGEKDVHDMWIEFCKDADIKPGLMDNLNFQNGKYLGKAGMKICTTHDTKCGKCYLDELCWTAYVKQNKV